MDFYLLHYRIVPNLDEDSPSSKSDSSDQEDGPVSITLLTQPLQHHHPKLVLNLKPFTAKSNSAEDDEIGDGLRTVYPTTATSKHASILERTNSLPFLPGSMERRRRKLPEIPKNKKCKRSVD